MNAIICDVCGARAASYKPTGLYDRYACSEHLCFNTRFPQQITPQWDLCDECSVAMCTAILAVYDLRRKKG